MNKLLADPKKRRQLLIAGVAAGGLILFVLIRKKPAREPVSETGAAAPVEQVPVEANGGGSGGGISSGESQELAGFIAQSEQNQLAQTEAITNALASLSSSNSQPVEGPAAPAAAQPGHGGTPLAGHLTNNQPHNPRAGDTFTQGTYKGKPAHIYDKAVPGGVGPKHNVVIVSSSRTPSRPPAKSKPKPKPKPKARAHPKPRRHARRAA